MREAFQTIKLTEESSMLTIMHTRWGRYRWTRLPFGVSAAPEESQRRLLQVICDMKGVTKYRCRYYCSRPTIFPWTGNPLSWQYRSKAAHNLNLNLDKISFKPQSAPFMGNVLTSSGRKPSPVISEAVLDMLQPSNKAAARHFKGPTKCLSKFFPHLGKLVHLLRGLIHLSSLIHFSTGHLR